MKRFASLWLTTAVVLIAYMSLPDGDDAPALDTPREAGVGDATAELAIVDALPHEAASGSVVALSYTGLARGAAPQVMLAKRSLRVLSQRQGSVVVELPAQLAPGRVKLRLASASERSKPYELKIKASDWRKPFRNLLGGWVLLVLGVRRLARAARSVSSLSSRRWPIHAGIAAAAVGAWLGAWFQSTTAVASLLAGGVSSRRLGLQPSAAGFLGAQAGAAAAPLLLASTAEPHTGLIAVAIGGLALFFASARSARAWAWLVLSAGLVTFAVQLLRPGFTPFLSDPRVLAALDGVVPQGFAGALARVLLGVLLVALFQGPAPVLVLALAASQLMGHEHPRETLLLLSGSGLGSALAASLTTPGGPRCRALAALNLLLGVIISAATAASVDLWARLAQRCARALGPIHWGSHLLPSWGFETALAFALSQLTAAVLLLPLLPCAQRVLPRLRPRRALCPASPALELGAVLAAQARALPKLLQLAVYGQRAAGNAAQVELHQAGARLQRLRAARAPAGRGRTALLQLGCLQLQRALESVLWHAEQLTDERVVCSGAALREHAVETLVELHTLLAEGLAAVQEHLQSGLAPAAEEARAREIQINALEAQLRERLAARSVDTCDLGVVRLVDALEVAGNQLFRLADVLTPHDPLDPPSYSEPEVTPPMAAGERGPAW